MRSTTRRKGRCRVVGHPPAGDRCRGSASARGPRSSKRLKSGKLPGPAYGRRAPRRWGWGAVESQKQSAALRSLVRACRARLTTSSLSGFFAESPATYGERRRGGTRGRGARSGCGEQSTRVAAGSACGVSSPGGGDTARGQAHRRVPSTTARGAIASPRSARLVQPLQKCPRPTVCLPLLALKDAACAEPRSARGSSASSSTRCGKSGQANGARTCRAIGRAAESPERRRGRQVPRPRSPRSGTHTVARHCRWGGRRPGLCCRMSVTRVLSHAPVQVGVGFDHHI